MTTSSSIPTTTTSGSTANSSAATAGLAGSQQLAGNFDTFLQLLTTQLQNQDPLDPLDTNQFTQQLVAFASVQQQVDMNTNMQTLISLSSAGPATGQVTITNSSGTVVYSGTTALNAGSNAFTWNGTGNTGQTWPAGQYTIAVTATSATGQAVTVTPQVTGTVTGVDLTQNPPQLIVGGQDYAMSAVQGVNSSTSTALSSTLSSINSALSTLNSLI
jgi:flagellar basal-body rod modification protein FlgD